MSDTLETVTITVNGAPLPFQSITVNVSAEAAVRDASAELAFPAKGLPCRPDDEAVITAGGDVLLTGYVRDVRPSHGDSDREMSVTFVSRTVDATECSVVHPDGEILDADLPTIARTFDALGIGIETDGTTFPVEPRHRLRAGETLFQTLERRARSRGVLICDTPEGHLKLAQGPEGTHSGALDLTRIKQGSATLTGRGRYSEITTRGQVSEGVKPEHLRIQARAEIDATRRRPLIKVHSGEGTLDRLKTRAAWEAKRAAGNGLTASVTVAGWRDSGGLIWRPNWLVSVADEWLGLDGLMIVKSVRLEQDGGGDGESGGTIAVLTLADPRALGGENPRGDTDAVYAAPGSVTAKPEVG